MTSRRTPTVTDSIDPLLNDMNRANALHALFLGAQGDATLARDKAEKTKASLGAKRTSDIAKAESTLKGRLTVIDDKYTEDMTQADVDATAADAAVIFTRAELVTLQEKILEDYNAKVDLLESPARGTSIVNV